MKLFTKNADGRYLILGILFSMSFLIPNDTKAQSAAAIFVKASVADGNKLTQAYLNPLLKRYGEGLSDGWTYTAAHERFTFKLVEGSAFFVPNSEKTFDASQIGLSSEVKIVGSPITPTVLGDKVNGAQFNLYAQNPYTHLDQEVGSFYGPQGFGVQAFGHSIAPSFMAPQIGVGILGNTELLFRFLPDIKFGPNGNYDYNILGFGLKHTLNGYLFGESDGYNSKMDKKDPFDLSVFAGYSMENIGYKVSIQPQNTSGTEGEDYGNQKVKTSSSSLTVGGIISKKISFITPHAGISYSSSKTTAQMVGTYPVNTYDNLGMPNTTNITDPISVKGSYSGLSANLGLNLNLYLIKINTEYVFSKYSHANVGVSIFF